MPFDEETKGDPPADQDQVSKAHVFNEFTNISQSRKEELFEKILS